MMDDGYDDDDDDDDDAADDDGDDDGDDDDGDDDVLCFLLKIYIDIPVFFIFLEDTKADRFIWRTRTSQSPVSSQDIQPCLVLKVQGRIDL